jgi:CheY-like chemotaxis protein
MSDAVQQIGHRARVLIVDDDPEILTFLSTLLDLEGSAPLLQVAGSAAGAPPRAAAALRLLEQGRKAALPDLLLLDIAMPDRDGLDLCRELKRDAGFRGIPVFVVSARPGKDVVDRAIAAGAEQFIRKPFENHELIERIRDRVRAEP